MQDGRRFTGKWAFFNLGGESAGTQIPTTASCHACHSTHTAVDNTFVQFYPVCATWRASRVPSASRPNSSGAGNHGIADATPRYLDA
ncbi:MAG: hypothetical protein WDO12_02885 [Pseudomonadota bacterium]